MMTSYKTALRLLLPLILLLNTSAYAQGLTQFPHACWQQKGVFQWDFNAGNAVVRNVVTYINDTAVCGKSYKKLLQEMNSWSTIDTTDLFVRNDNGKVYLTYTPSCSDSGDLVFDFTLLPGDTFVKNNGLFDYTDTVASVSTAFIDGEPRKKIAFTFAEWDVWIDGIGDSTRGLLTQNVGFEGAHYELICQRDSNGIVFTNPKDPYPVDSTGHLHICDSIQSVEPCQIANGINAIQHSDVFIYPNPNNGSFLVSFTQNDVGSEVTMVDLNGREIYKTKANTPLVPFNLQAVAPGIYTLRVNNGKHVTVKKLLIQ